jgi:hypothetical protein
MVLYGRPSGSKLTEAARQTPRLEMLTLVELQSKKISHYIEKASGLRDQRSQYTASMQEVKMNSLLVLIQVKNELSKNSMIILSVHQKKSS